MKRRHVIALIILALVVATVLAMGPERVWDPMTTKTVEQYWPNGQLSARYRMRRWSGRIGLVQGWTPDGKLNTNIWVFRGQLVTGIESGAVPVRYQKRYVNGKRVELRTSPPWFTEEEILQSVEGVEE